MSLSRHESAFRDLDASLEVGLHSFQMVMLLWVYPVDETRKRDGIPDVLQLADP